MATQHKPVVAIAGATGHLGQHITNTLLAPSFSSSFSRIILLTRSSPTSSTQLQTWQDQGAEVRQYSEDNLSASLSGIDVLVNCIGSPGHHFKDDLAKALPKTDVKLYLPSEFGVDHSVHDFAHPEWDAKKAHVALVKRTAPKVKVCSVYCGLFLEDAVCHWFGFEVEKRPPVFEAVGSADTKTSYTALEDVGRAVGVLALMPVEQVPGVVRLAGDTVSMRGVAGLMGGVSDEHIEVKEVGLDEYKRRTLESKVPKPSWYLRFLMGEGKLDHGVGGLGNQNEVVNPVELRWRWKTMKEWAKETGGRPGV